MRREIAPDDNFERMMQPEELAKFIVDIVEEGNLLDNQVLVARGGKYEK